MQWAQIFFFFFLKNLPRWEEGEPTISRNDTLWGRWSPFVCERIAWRKTTEVLLWSELCSRTSLSTFLAFAERGTESTLNAFSERIWNQSFTKMFIPVCSQFQSLWDFRFVVPTPGKSLDVVWFQTPLRVRRLDYASYLLLFCFLQTDLGTVVIPSSPLTLCASRCWRKTGLCLLFDRSSDESRSTQSITAADIVILLRK